jgi:hypothetical protein
MWVLPTQCICEFRITLNAQPLFSYTQFIRHSVYSRGHIFSVGTYLEKLVELRTMMEKQLAEHVASMNEYCSAYKK